MPVVTFDDLKEREREAKRELILSAAMELFALKEFKSVTIREIAKAAKLSPGTIYRYYENLDDLFVDVFFLGANEIVDILTEEYKRNEVLSIERFSKAYIGYLNDNMSFFQMMSHFMLGGKLSEDATLKLNPTMRGLIYQIERVIKGNGITKDTRRTAHALFSALNGIMISYVKYPGRTREEIRSYTLELAGVIADLFFRQMN